MTANGTGAAKGKKGPEATQATIDAARAAATEAAAPAPEEERGKLRLRNGIVLKIDAVPPMLIREAQMRIVKPEPPIVLPTGREPGEEEPNPDDPKYKEAMEQYAMAQFLAAGNAALLLGTKIIEVPPDMYPIEGEEWLEDLHHLGVDPDVSTRPARYLAYMNLYALRSEVDQSLALMAPLMASGLSEEEVSAAVDSFRRSKAWRSNNGGVAAQPDQPGDRLPEDSAGAGVGD